jgi:hypothetical protein
MRGCIVYKPSSVDPLSKSERQSLGSESADKTYTF